MKNIAVLYGGDSVESDVSIITATVAISGLSMSDYKSFPIYIRDGKMWLVSKEIATNLSTYTHTEKGMMKEVVILFGSLYIKTRWRIKFVCNIDCALLATHGGSGENGGLQGLLDMNNIPYTSSGVLGSSVCMDKDLTHRFAKSMGIGTVKYHLAKDTSSATSIESAFNALGMDVIVKPNSLGSSVGVASIKSLHSLHSAVADAFRYDNKVLIQERVSSLIEVNCAVIRTRDGLVVSDVLPVGFEGDVFDFEEKYITGNLDNESDGILPKAIINKAASWARKMYVELGLCGVVRIDYLYDSIEGKLYLNEVNTIPGSLAFYLFEGKGLDMTDIASEMIECAIDNARKGQKLVTKFSSSILTLRENNMSKLIHKIRK